MADIPTSDPDIGENAEVVKLDRSTPDFAIQAAEQRIILRWASVIVAFLIIVAFGYIEWCLLRYILESGSKSSDSLIFLAISPIVGITVVIVFILMGVFRGFKERDMSNLPPSTILRNILGD